MPKAISSSAPLQQEHPLLAPHQWCMLALPLTGQLSMRLQRMLLLDARPLAGMRRAALKSAEKRIANRVCSEVCHHAPLAEQWFCLGSLGPRLSYE
jgi:hypothetical protein